MKQIAWGLVAGGVAAFVGSATAHATGETWTPGYDVDNAQLFAQLPMLTQPGWSPAWEMPASFTSSDGTVLTGTDYVSAAPGGLNNEFVTDDGATYDQNQLFPGFTNLYYDPAGDGAAVDVLKTPFGDVDLASAPSWAVPDFPQGSADVVGHNIVVTDGGDTRIYEALGLTGQQWVGGPTDQAPITTLQTPDSSLVWAVPATFTTSDGGTTLTGSEYVASPTDVAFVDQAGDVFDQHTLVYGLFPVENLYYDPVDSPAQDYLEMFGLIKIDISPIASWFAPDVSDLVTPSPATDLADAGLYSALDLAFGLTS